MASNRDTVPDRYTPDNLGTYSVHSRNGTKSVTLGPAAVKHLLALGIEDGDKIIAEEHEDGILVRPATEAKDE